MSNTILSDALYTQLATDALVAGKDIVSSLARSILQHIRRMQEESAKFGRLACSLQFRWKATTEAATHEAQPNKEEFDAAAECIRPLLKEAGWMMQPTTTTADAYNVWNQAWATKHGQTFVL